MTDILIPVRPAELVDQIVSAETSEMPLGPGESDNDLVPRLTQMRSIAATFLPTDTDVSPEAIRSARRDVCQLIADLNACEARADFGIGFIALARAYLDALHTLGHCKAEYDAAALNWMQMRNAPSHDFEGEA
ncbi:MAG: hypothetical protein AAFQ09_00910 [Pseudomonadota bacterium]